MKKAIIFSVMLVLALGLFSCNGKKSKGLSITEETTSQKAPEKDLDYVDLGLPSGTLWKNANEGGDDALYTYDEAVSKFGDKLPTKEQLEELKNKCTWTWTGNGYKVTGPNGESITLPAAGSRNSYGGVYEVGGHYWSATESDSVIAYFLRCDSDGANFPCNDRHRGLSVRLVKDLQ